MVGCWDGNGIYVVNEDVSCSSEHKLITGQKTYVMLL